MTTKNTLFAFALGYFYVQGVLSQSILDPRVLDASLFQINVKAQHYLTNDKTIKIRYIFSTNNNSNSRIYRLFVGEKSLTDTNPAIQIDNMDNRFTNVIAPNSWVGEAERGDQPRTLFTWRINENLDSDLAAREVVSQPPNSVWESYIVESPRRYPSLYNSYAAIDTSLSKNYSSTLLKYDTVSPTGSVLSTVVANTLNKAVVDVVLKLSVKDDYDPLPEIVFDSIKEITSETTGSIGSPFEVTYTYNLENNPSTGQYPTVFTFKKDISSAKKFKISYKMTDASGNQRILSKVVTIPKL